jgi:hypothetical protein
MKNDNTLILGFLIALFILEISNALSFKRISKNIEKVNETVIQYFEAPLPDINFEEESQDGRNK